MKKPKKPSVKHIQRRYAQGNAAGQLMLKAIDACEAIGFRVTLVVRACSRSEWIYVHETGQPTVSVPGQQQLRRMAQTIKKGRR